VAATSDFPADSAEEDEYQPDHQDDDTQYPQVGDLERNPSTKSIMPAIINSAPFRCVCVGVAIHPEVLFCPPAGEIETRATTGQRRKERAERRSPANGDPRWQAYLALRFFGPPEVRTSRRHAAW
jgi:hypothetical protein